MSDDYTEPPVEPMADKVPVPIPGHSARAISIRTAEDGRVGLYMARDLWARTLSVMVSQDMDEDVKRLGENMASDLGFTTV